MIEYAREMHHDPMHCDILQCASILAGHACVSDTWLVKILPTIYKSAEHSCVVHTDRYDVTGVQTATYASTQQAQGRSGSVVGVC